MILLGDLQTRVRLAGPSASRRRCSPGPILESSGGASSKAANSMRCHALALAVAVAGQRVAAAGAPEAERQPLDEAPLVEPVRARHHGKVVAVLEHLEADGARRLRRRRRRSLLLVGRRLVAGATPAPAPAPLGVSRHGIVVVAVLLPLEPGGRHIDSFDCGYYGGVAAAAAALGQKCGYGAVVAAGGRNCGYGAGVAAVG